MKIFKGKSELLIPCYHQNHIIISQTAKFYYFSDNENLYTPYQYT